MTLVWAPIFSSSATGLTPKPGQVIALSHLWYIHSNHSHQGGSCGASSSPVSWMGLNAHGDPGLGLSPTRVLFPIPLPISLQLSSLSYQLKAKSEEKKMTLTTPRLKIQSTIWFQLHKGCWYLSSTANQIPSFLCFWSTMLMGWECLWLDPSHYVCFPFTEPGLCTHTRFLFCFA